MLFGQCLRFATVVAVGGLLTVGEALAQHPTITETGLTTSIQLGSKIKATTLLEFPQALFLPNASELTPLDEAYLDAFSILKEPNTCSAFYGGPSAIEVLNQLKRQLKVANLDGTVTVRMTGKAIDVTNLTYSVSYRLFDRAELNVDGPFYSGNAFNSRLSMPNIGGFLPNTREARVTILLHELGHLIKRSDKQWLLPNDGGNDYLSQENTKHVIALCGAQIRRLSTISFAQELQVARTTSSSPATNANVLKP